MHLLLFLFCQPLIKLEKRLLLSTNFTNRSNPLCAPENNTVPFYATEKMLFPSLPPLEIFLPLCASPNKIFFYL
jgi:hypothetical protein